MPRSVFGPDFQFLPRAEILSFEEIERLARVFVSLGVRKIRLTGGEPLARKDLPRLVEALAQIPGLDDLALTTNGSLLPKHAQSLRQAGLRRLTVSLDALDDEIFRTMNDANVPVARVLGGIEAARQAGFGPIKINMVVRRGINESQILPMAEYCRATGDVLRFIEFMDVGTTNRWNLTEVMPAADILDMLSSRWPMEPLSPVVHGEVAERYAYADGATEIGIISSVTRPFCSTCVRARLSAKGELFTCLFAASGHDLRAPLRSGANEEELSLLVGNIWRGRADRYSELRSSISKPRSKVEMSYIGG